MIQKSTRSIKNSLKTWKIFLLFISQIHYSLHQRFCIYFSSTVCASCLIGAGTFFSGFVASIVDKNKKFEESGRVLLLITIVVYFVLMFVMFREEMPAGFKGMKHQSLVWFVNGSKGCMKILVVCYSTRKVWNTRLTFKPAARQAPIIVCMRLVKHQQIDTHSKSVKIFIWLWKFEKVEAVSRF